MAGREAGSAGGGDPARGELVAAEERWDAIYGLPLRLATTARRLDVSPVWFAHRGAAASLPWVAFLDMAAVREHCAGLADTVTTEAGLAPYNTMADVELVLRALKR